MEKTDSAKVLTKSESVLLQAQSQKNDCDGADTDDGSSDTEQSKRDTWTDEVDFLFALIGFAVGLGNVWRFPYLCYKNGGGVFLIPYFFSLIATGFGVLILELGLGQFTQTGGISCWNICPLFKGIGGSSIIILTALNIYYNIVIAWAIYYLFMSFTTNLPWSHCKNDWNTPDCLDPDIQYNSSIMSLCTESSNPGLVCVNGTLQNASSFSSAVTEFWERKILKIHLSDGLGDPGGMNWQMVLCLALAWILIYLCICKGVKSSGKVVYFTGTSPYVILFILLGFSLSLDHAMDGIVFYLKPDWARLTDVQVWLDAMSQIFFSYGIGLGAMSSLGSYNKRQRNFVRDGLIFACVNSGTSFLAGFNVFAVLGFMAAKQGVDIASVAESGPGLIFIAYPEGVAQMPVSTLWAILFFLMVLLLGIDSQFVGVEGLITAIVDLFPEFFMVGHRRALLTVTVCISGFLLGLSMCTYGGMYLFQLFDYYAVSGMTLLWAAFFECIAIGWVYGAGRFSKDLSDMLGFQICSWFRLSWMTLTPICTAAIFVCSLVLYEHVKYNNTYVYPTWGYGVGLGLAFISMIQIPLCAIVQFLLVDGTFTERWKILTTPRNLPDWYQSEQKLNDETPLIRETPR